MSDAVPFTIAPSASTSSTITYTFTGPKVGGTQGIACLLLALGFMPGGVMMAIQPLVGPQGVSIFYPLYGIILIVVSIVSFRYGIGLIFKSKSRHQIVIDRDAGLINHEVSGTNPSEHSNGSVLYCGMLDIKSNQPKIKYWNVSIVADDLWLVVGVLKSAQRAQEFAAILVQETGLPFQDQSQQLVVSAVYNQRLVPSDSRAMKKPIKTRALKG